MDHGLEVSDAPADRDDALAPLLAPELAPLFMRPTRLRVDSAWYGHVPFAHWLVNVSRPRVLVELGSHAGVSYSAFCESVLRERLDTLCFAVDTWQGDEHAGFYAESIHADLKRFHDARYGGFSEMLRCTFEAALPCIQDGSVDLLHIDGRHHYEDVLTDFTTWRPKLSPRAVVLFHDTHERRREFGVWRLWAELCAEWPGFEFHHGHGLGVLAYGSDVPPAVRALCSLRDPAAIAVLRERFALLGERWIADFDLFSKTRELEDSEQAVVRTTATAAELQRVIEQQHGQLVELIPRADRARALRIELTAARLDRLEADRRAAERAVEDEQRVQQAFRAAEQRVQEAIAWGLAEQARAAAAEQRITDLKDEQARLRASISWRVTKPLRAARRFIARQLAPPQAPKMSPPPAPVIVPPPPVSESPAPVPPEAKPAYRGKILFASGEAHTPGSLYRCTRMVSLAEACGWAADWRPIGDIGVPPLVGVDLIVLWRVEFTDHVQGVIDYVHAHGGRVAFDIDDLVFKPDMASEEMLDSVRIGTFSENGALALFRRFRSTLIACDLCLCTTEEIAGYLRRTEKPTWVVPNGFDDAAERAARFARRVSDARGPDGLVRIGYAAGSRTHQKDFAVVAEALAAVLRARPQARLVLFQDPDGREGVVLLREFPALAERAPQIEWRDMVPLSELPGELARFDINIAPLEADNPFCDAKSELKYFEAGLVDVCTIATPTGPLSRAISDGKTGFLAADPAAWEAILLRLIDDPALRRRVGRNAYHDALWQFGPRRRAALLGGFLDQFRGGQQAAAAFEREIHRGTFRARRLPLVPEAETLFESDRLLSAEVTVTIASYNYSAYVLEALESVQRQTLEPLDLIVVDDVSPDDSVAVILDWVRSNAEHFGRVRVLRHRANTGLGASRNSGFNAAETPFVLPLDSDNRLHPTCCARLLEKIRGSGAAYAYPQLQQFGAAEKISGGETFEPRRLVGGNFIDAMALVAKWAWAAGGGYYQDREALGWEDFDLWCSLAELGQWGEAVPEVLAEYRVHAGSMVNAITETSHTKRRVVETVEQRHPWLKVTGRTPQQR